MKKVNALKIAAINSWSEPMAVEKNIDGIRVFISKLENLGVEYALFPELSVSGYINNSGDLKRYAHMHEAVLKEMLNISKTCSLAFSIGLPMPLNKGVGIAQISFNNGEIIHTHFKTHLSVNEKKIYQSGNSISTYSNMGIHIGQQICLESHYPELSLLLQQQGAELLCFAFASPRETPEEKLARLKMILQARAYDNCCFVMACNLTGKTPSGKNYSGTSVIISPRGKVLAEYSSMEPGYCMAQIDMSAIEKLKRSKMSNFPAYRNTEMKIRIKNS